MPVQVAQFPSCLFLPAILLLLIGLVITIVRYWQTPRRNTAIAAVALALGLAGVSGAFAYAAYQAYVRDNTWTFGYFLTLQGNGTVAESLVVPIPGDEGLLAGLRLDSGTANWSLIDTPRGRGLFVRFAGSANIRASASLFPRPATLPDASPTMTLSTNCTVEPSNCTGPPSVWIFYSGLAGAHLLLSFGSFIVEGYLEKGWAAYESLPVPVPTP